MLSASRADRDDLGIKYNALSERVSRCDRVLPPQLCVLLCLSGGKGRDSYFLFYINITVIFPDEFKICQNLTIARTGVPCGSSDKTELWDLVGCFRAASSLVSQHRGAYE